MEVVAPILDLAIDHPYLSSASIVLGCAALTRLVLRQRPDLPPGPKGYPIVGNLFDLPPSHVWEKFSEFGKQYGALLILGYTHGLCFFANIRSRVFPQAMSHTWTSWVKTW